MSLEQRKHGPIIRNGGQRLGQDDGVERELSQGTLCLVLMSEYHPDEEEVLHFRAIPHESCSRDEKGGVINDLRFEQENA